jgi:hypothetical protein
MGVPRADVEATGKGLMAKMQLTTIVALTRMILLIAGVILDLGILNGLEI